MFYNFCPYPNFDGFYEIRAVVRSFISVVDRHRFDAYPEPDPNFHIDADQDLVSDPDWHKNDADAYADLFPSFTHVGISYFLNSFSYS
jgi:hypothetical protein